jgi:hypothetical protein
VLINCIWGLGVKKTADFWSVVSVLRQERRRIGENLGDEAIRSAVYGIAEVLGGTEAVARVRRLMEDELCVIQYGE